MNKFNPLSIARIVLSIGGGALVGISFGRSWTLYTAGWVILYLSLIVLLLENTHEN